MDNGAFDGLSAGKPLPKVTVAHVPNEELRMGYRMMKNAGFAGKKQH
ncbi:DnaJ family domain-containing protein [Bacillus sp. SL00103]